MEQGKIPVKNLYRIKFLLHVNAMEFVKVKISKPEEPVPEAAELIWKNKDDLKD